MAEVTKEPQGKAQHIMKELQQVTTKNPKKVEAGKRLAESNCKKREAKKQAKLETSRNWRPVNQYTRILQICHTAREAERQHNIPHT